MVPIRTLAVGCLVGLASLAASTSTLAVPVVATVSGPTAAAVTVGTVPDPELSIPIIDFALDVQQSSVSVSKVVTNIPTGAETADGAAAVDIDLTDINKSVARSRSMVSTADSPATPNQDFRMTDGSVGGFSATLSTTGLAPGDLATVDLLLRVSGMLIYKDPGGTAGTTKVSDPFDDTIFEMVPDMSANVSVILALADVLQAIGTVPPDPLPFAPLFNGSATLQSKSAGMVPELVRIGDWASAARNGDFQGYSSCSATLCEVNIAMSLLFEDVQSLGFGATFDIGLLLETNADAISDTGRTVASNFFDSAKLELSLAVVPGAQVPEPATLALLGLALAGLGFARRRKLH